MAWISAGRRVCVCVCVCVREREREREREKITTFQIMGKINFSSQRRKKNKKNITHYTFGLEKRPA